MVIATFLLQSVRYSCVCLMAGWPGSYFQVIYPMGASAGTGTAPETPPPAMGGAPGGVAAVPAAASGAVPRLQW